MKIKEWQMTLMYRPTDNLAAQVSGSRTQNQRLMAVPCTTVLGCMVISEKTQ